MAVIGPVLSSSPGCCCGEGDLVPTTLPSDHASTLLPANQSGETLRRPPAHVTSPVDVDITLCFRPYRPWKPERSVLCAVQGPKASPTSPLQREAQPKTADRTLACHGRTLKRPVTGGLPNRAAWAERKTGERRAPSCMSFLPYVYLDVLLPWWRRDAFVGGSLPLPARTRTRTHTPPISTCCRVRGRGRTNMINHE